MRKGVLGRWGCALKGRLSSLGRKAKAVCKTLEFMKFYRVSKIEV